VTDVFWDHQFFAAGVALTACASSCGSEDLAIDFGAPSAGSYSLYTSDSPVAGPWSSLFGLTALGAVLVSTWWVPGLRITLTAGLPWLLFISLCYAIWNRRHPPTTGNSQL
jgi:hypothetical protein